MNSDCLVERAIPHATAVVGATVFAAAIIPLYLAAPIPAVIAAVGLVLVAAGYLMHSGRLYVAQLQLAEFERRDVERILDQRIEDIATGSWPIVHIANHHGRHAGP